MGKNLPATSAPRPAATGAVIYLLHFETPYRHARHYTGWTAGDLDARLKQHERGTGALLPLSLVSTTTGSFQSQFPVCTVVSS